MKKNTVIAKIGLFLIVVIFSSLTSKSIAQTIQAKNVAYIPEIEVLFNEGINYYHRKDYNEAKDVFANLLKSYPIHQRITASYIMLGKCLLQSNETRQALSVLSELIEKYPHSNYVVDAHYVMGLCYYQMNNYSNSLKEFLLVADISEKESLVEKSRNVALKIIDNNITLNEIEKLREAEKGKISSAMLTIKSAQRYLGIGKRERAISMLQKFAQRFPDSPYLSYVNELLKNANVPSDYSEVKVGVILPLSGEYAEQARGILAGIRYAQKKFNARSKVKVEIVSKDTEGDIVKTIRAAQELAADNKIVAILGELERDKTIAIEAVLSNKDLPLIAPATSANDVTALSEYAFQINPSLDVRGKVLAEYAIKKMGLKTFATLAPMDNYGKNMTDSFTSTVDALGGKIVAQKWYYANTEDVGKQLAGIRELGIKFVNKDAVDRAHTRGMNLLERQRFEMEDFAVNSIDCLFLPVYTEEIKFIAPQFAFANLKAHLLGGEFWNETEELRKVQQYVDGIVFCSDYFFDEADPEFIKFQNDFRFVLKRTPGVMEYYGIDAMAVVLDAIEHNNLTRDDIKSYLNNLENFIGLRGPITLKNNDRINSRIKLLTFKNGKIESAE